MGKGANFACLDTGKCEILPGKRSSCAACRLKKCISVGMSKSAIKTGRYTYAKRARDIMEVKGLKEQPAACPELELPEWDATSRSKTQMVARSHPTERGTSRSEPSTDELDEVIQLITEVQAKVTFWTPDVLAKQAEREQIYLKLQTMRQQIFGPLKTLTEEEFMKIYQTTGIEIDERRHLLQTSYQQYVGEDIKRYAEFVKAIPGFCELPIEDQTALFKASRWAYFFITSQRAFNPSKRLYVNYDGYVVSVEDMNALGHAYDENEMMFKVQEKLQKLDLNEEENSILAALCVMSADVCNLGNADQVVRSQSLLRKCLLRLMDKYHRDDPWFIARVFAILLEIRSTCEVLKLGEVETGLRWADRVEVPPLLCEMWSLL